MSKASLAGDSDLEREFELEFAEGETDDAELEEDFEALDGDEASGSESEYESEYEAAGTDYAERFFELSQREFESESEVDSAVNQILGDMEREYFFKNLLKGVRSAGSKFLTKGVGQLAKKLGGKFPAIKAVTQLARGNLRGMLGPLAKTALTAAFPGAAAALPMLDSLGFKFEAQEDAEAQRAGWNSYVTLAREAYEELATNLGPEAQDPLGANRLAASAFKRALARTGGRTNGSDDVRRIQVRRGQRIVLEVV